jgi:hypothetical protein
MKKFTFAAIFVLSLASIFGFLLLLPAPAQAQLKDMPSQAEFDPILENAGKKLKDFVATLTEFRIEAAAMDQERLDGDLKAVKQLQEMIQVAHSGSGENKGANMLRLVGILAGLDDMALDAATWKALADLRLCQQLVQHQSPTPYDQFGTRVAMNSVMLHEVGGQLLHPTFRMASAADEIVLMLSDASSKTKPKPR